ncbi:MAG: glycerophosphodiester phosphodiesterase family protein [Bacteroidota bacterium]
MAKKAFWKRGWVRLLLVLILLISLVKIYNWDLLAPDSPNDSPLIIAHRGWSSEAPENTLSAIKLALEKEADMIEFDLHMSRDQVPVVIHDPTLERTTNGTGEVKEMSLFELRKLDAGSWFGDAYIGERIPTLTEVMAMVQGKSKLLIELKWDDEGEVYPGLVDSVLAEIARFNGQNWCEIHTFDASMVRDIREKAPEQEVQKLIVYDLAIVPGHVDRKWQWSDGSKFDEGVSGINVWLKGLSPRLVNRIHAQGKKVYVFTVNEPDDVAYCKKLGVDGLITDGLP